MTPGPPRVPLTIITEVIGVSAFLIAPAADDRLNVNIVRPVLPLRVEVDIVAAGRRIGAMKPEARWQWSCFAQHKGLSPRQTCENVDKVTLGLRNEASHVGLIIRVGQAQTDERAALRQNSLGDFVRTLAHDPEPDAVLAAFLRDAFHGSA